MAGDVLAKGWMMAGEAWRGWMAGGWLVAGRMSGESFNTCNISCISWDKVVTWHCSLAMAVLEGVVGMIGLGLELGLSFSH